MSKSAGGQIAVCGEAQGSSTRLRDYLVPGHLVAPAVGIWVSVALLVTVAAILELESDDDTLLWQKIGVQTDLTPRPQNHIRFSVNWSDFDPHLAPDTQSVEYGFKRKQPGFGWLIA